MTPNQRRLEARYPGILSRVGSYVVSTAKHIASGRPVVDDATYTTRREACNTCPHRDTVHDSCPLCGCNLGKSLKGDKLRRLNSRCPDNPSRWPLPMLQEEQAP